MRLRLEGIVLALAVVAAGCSLHAPGSPESIAEGALRASVEMEVAPAGYSSGPISDQLANEWTDRVESDYRRWYASPMLDRMLDGLHNVVGSHRTDTAPIVGSVDVTNVEVPPASVSGDAATVEDAVISYVQYFVGGTWSPEAVPGATECWYTLHRTADGWRVVDASCNVSGG